MKMRLGVCTFLLACGFVEGLKYRDGQQRTLADPKADADPEAKSEGTAAEGSTANNTKAGNETAPPAMEGPAHEDNFQDELVDQADPEFKKVSGGDDCISLEDFKKPLLEQFQLGSIDRKDMSEEEKKMEKEMMDDMMKDLEMIFKYADRLDKEDGCITEAEYKKGKELEGPPPGFQDHKKDKCEDKFEDKCEEEDKNKCEDEFEEEMKRQEKFEFDAMDRSGDNKISKPEAYHYASENMPEADVDQADLDDMFNAADTDKDGFVSYDEFRKAGEEIEGDGNEMEGAPPMAFQIMDARLLQKRRVVEKKLAEKPESAVLARMLSWDDEGSTRPAARRRKCSH